MAINLTPTEEDEIIWKQVTEPVSTDDYDRVRELLVRVRQRLRKGVDSQTRQAEVVSYANELIRLLNIQRQALGITK